jgi:methylmalonyl-CoA/ethylmalonyl-CoA epimerase
MTTVSLIYIPIIPSLSAKLDKVISKLTDEDLPVISSFNTPIAKIVFFDTIKEIGVMTEIMGITKEGEEQVEKMKKELSPD